MKRWDLYFFKVFFVFERILPVRLIKAAFISLRKTLECSKNVVNSCNCLETMITNFRFYFILNKKNCNVHYNVKVPTVTKSILAEFKKNGNAYLTVFVNTVAHFLSKKVILGKASSWHAFVLYTTIQPHPHSLVNVYPHKSAISA